MFRKPIKVEIDANSTTVHHEIHVSTATFLRAHMLVEKVGKTAIAVVVVAAAAKTASQIITHTAKTVIQ
jgi:hypothetical protein